jgi:hypothetical protein
VVSIPHRLYVSPNQFTTTPSTHQSKPVHHHAVYTSVQTSSPPRRLHISPNQFITTPSKHQSKPVHHHTVYTSVPTSSPPQLHLSPNQFTTTPSTHHPHAPLTLTSPHLHITTSLRLLTILNPQTLIIIHFKLYLYY